MQNYNEIKRMLSGIPRQRWGIFLPPQRDGLALMESNIVKFRRRANLRERVMNIQRLCGFPLRPNEPLREVEAKARIQGIKRGRIRRRNKGDDDYEY